MNKTNEIRVRIPQITSVETAIRLYYERIELSNNDIRELFGKVSPNKIIKLKNKAREVMSEEKTPIWNAQNVNTDAAFKAWGLDIADLEKRYKKICALNARSEKVEKICTGSGRANDPAQASGDN